MTQLPMKTLLPLLSLLMVFQLNAQINVGSVRQTKLDAGDIEKEDLNKLRQAPTYFIIRPEDEPFQEQLQSILDEVWTFNKIETIKRSKLAKMDPKERATSAFLGIEGHATTVQMKTTSYVNAHYYLHLSMVGDHIPYTDKELKKLQRKGERATPRFEINTFARIALFPDGELVKKADEFRKQFSLTDSEKNEHMDFVYNEAKLYNWEYGYLKNYFQEVNRVLEAGETRWYFVSDQNDRELKRLRRATLYIPDHILIKLNKFTGSEDKRHEVADIFGDYDFNYKILSPEDLNVMILEATEPFFYFNYIRSSTDAFYTITNGLTGEIIYSKYDPATYNIKGKNMKELSKAIEKAK
jgi:hypothetical protein